MQEADLCFFESDEAVPPVLPRVLQAGQQVHAQNFTERREYLLRLCVAGAHGGGAWRGKGTGKM